MKIKGYLNIVGYKVLADENVDPGRYGFRIIHDTEKSHLFSSDEQLIVREWMKALMKATITRDYTSACLSASSDHNRSLVSIRSCNVLLQYPHYPLDRGAGDESGASTAFAIRTRGYAEGAAQREPEPAVKPRRAGTAHGHAQQESD